VYLKSLTLRGFKSFASSTTLEFESGITCIVGPNGSGKSNVVDALSWVMGEQGAKSLRGGKMEDVIFAGTSGRAPLGRAEVLVTIDNTDGALPIDYSEVTVSRTMFRNGGSDYAINGQTCRLLDVQELLSDSGIGREMHVIVGQGQLDVILHASPEDRRGFIEEAAGVLKHRKRKEKALRKLDATESNLTRLHDLITELRRQLKPLGRQAEVARKAAVVQANVRDARARLLADDLVALRTGLERELAEEAAVRRQRAEVEAAMARARAAESELETALRADAPRQTTAQETWFGLSSLRERVRGTASLAAERLRNLAEQTDEQVAGRDPEELVAEASRVRAQEAQILAEVKGLRAALESALRDCRAAEAEHADEDHKVAGLLRAAADRREGLARLTGQVNALKSRAEGADAELDRLGDARQNALARAARAQREFTALETTIAGLDAGEGGLDEEHEGALSLLQDLEDRLGKTRDETQAAERERAALAARKEALELSLARKDGAASLLAGNHQVSGILGSVAAMLSIRPGCESAIAAALGSAADAVALVNADAAVEAMIRLKVDDLGRAGMVLAGAGGDDTSWPALPPGATYAIDMVTGPTELRPAVRRLLFKVAVVDDLAAARELLETDADLVAVTRDGDLLGSHFAAGGSSSSSTSLIEVQAAVDDAAARLEDATHACERLRFEQSRLEDERAHAQRAVDVALAKLHESDAAMAAVAEQLAQLGSLARSARGEAERISEAIQAAEAGRDRELTGLSALQARLADAEDSLPDEPNAHDLERLAEAARSARQTEMDARLTLRTSEERARALHDRAEGLESAARAERETRGRAAARRERRIQDATAAEAVVAATRFLLIRLDESLQEAATTRSVVDRDRTAREQLLADARSRLRTLDGQLDELTDVVHRDEMARAEQRMRIEQLERRGLDELGLSADRLVGEYGPDQLVPPSPAAHDERREVEPAPLPYNREQQKRRLLAGERQLAMLGKINPLALEEFSALEERHQFLGEQLDDLKRTRRDLLDIVHEVDDRVEQIFSEAFLDVEREFELMFARLFPGGQGRLVLSDPSDMLGSGVEVEARPPGKRIKRLSLLSGGERALVAVAFLVALFKARPSPFYILDEVEAALDEINLGRLLEIYEELRENSQLVVITHQKRTMEVADALYGISMRGDGVSAVISQRLREAAPA
jgi:chromosome segregation protein